MKDNKIFLVGMPSSGKSTIGKLLATQLCLKFIDLDDVIIKRESMSISDIFALKGEKYFREIEKKCLSSQLDADGGFVMATGGGTPCFFDNMNLMNGKGLTVFLDISVKDLYDKLSRKGTDKRPLLQNMSSDGLYNELKAKYEVRKLFYTQSKICMVQKFNNIADRVNQIIDAISSLEKNANR